MTGERDLASLLGIAWKLALFAALLVAANHASDWIVERLNARLTLAGEPYLHRIIVVAAIVYVVLMMLPFVPGVEVGLAMMALLGPDIAPLVYGCTILSLCLAFLVGRLVPERRVIAAFDRIGLKRAGGLVRDLAARDPGARMDWLLQRSQSRAVPIMLRYRFLGLMVALNTPGNFMIGGGGGICMTAGFSRLFPFPVFAAVVAVAVAPVPLVLFLAG